MANSPKNIVFFLYDAAGAPLPSIVPTFTTYATNSGTPVTPVAITNPVDNVYAFTPVFADPVKGIAFVVDGGVTSFPRYIAGYVRPEDYNEDQIPDAATAAASAETAAVAAQAAAVSAQAASIDALAAAVEAVDVATGGWRLDPVAKQLIIYAPDNTTVLATFNCFDSTGTASVTEVYRRVRV